MTGLVALVALLLLCCLHSEVINEAADDQALLGGLVVGNQSNTSTVQENKCNITTKVKTDSTGYQKCIFCEAVSDAECRWCWDDDNYLTGSCNATTTHCKAPRTLETNNCDGGSVPLAVVIIAILIPICCICVIVGACTYLCMKVTNKRVDPMIDPRFLHQPPGSFYPPPWASGQHYVQYVGQDPNAYAVPTNAIVIPNSQVSIPILDAQIIPLTTMKPQPS